MLNVIYLIKICCYNLVTGTRPNSKSVYNSYCTFPRLRSQAVVSNIVNTVKSESNVTLTVAAAPIALVTNDTNEEIPTTEVSTVTVPATTVRIPPLKYLLKYLSVKVSVSDNGTC